MKPLRVLIATQSYYPRWGGIAEHVRHLSLALMERGHHVRVLTSTPGPPGGDLPGPEDHPDRAALRGAVERDAGEHRVPSLLSASSA